MHSYKPIRKYKYSNLNTPIKIDKNLKSGKMGERYTPEENIKSKVIIK